MQVYLTGSLEYDYKIPPSLSLSLPLQPSILSASLPRYPSSHTRPAPRLSSLPLSIFKRCRSANSRNTHCHIYSMNAEERSNSAKQATPLFFSSVTVYIHCYSYDLEKYMKDCDSLQAYGIHVRARHSIRQRPHSRARKTENLINVFSGVRSFASLLMILQAQITEKDTIPMLIEMQRYKILHYFILKT